MARGVVVGDRRRRAAIRARSRNQRVFAHDAKKGSWILRLLTLLVFAVVLSGGATIIAAVVFYTRTAAEIGSPGAVIAALADYGGAQIYDRHGTLLYRFPDPQGGIQAPMPLSQISPAAQDATVSTEDATFWENPGVDVQGIGAALVRNLQTNGDPFTGAGGSAITQQLVKNTLIPQEERTARSLNRKATELVYALKLTRDYPKSQILDWYLNTVNYGGVYDGIESAAEGYFGIHAKDLDLAQAAMLAGIPQSPADYSPYSNPTGARARQAEVLDLMVKHGKISQLEADTAKQENLRFQGTQQSLPLRAPWFVEYVKQRLIARFGQRCFDTCGLVVHTTLDLELEDKAQQILDENLKKYGDATGVHNGALLSIDARNGQILVMLGSRDYNNETLPIQGNNNFTTAILQPGSSFKPFVYMTLFQKRGYGPSSVIWDVPYTSREGYRCENPLPGNRTTGPVPVRIALGSSLNCPANRAADAAGVQNVIDLAHKMGINTLNDAQSYGASIATGGANVTMLDLAYAYTTLARNGSMIGDTTTSPEQPGYRTLDPVAFTEVTDGRGAVRYHYEPKTEQAVPPQYPYLITSIISNCENRRLIWACGFPQFVLSDKRPVAVKTGTQAGAKTAQTLANWMFMYTPQIVTGGWVGNADRTNWTDVNGSSNAVGYSVQQLEDLVIKSYNIPAADFERPSGIVSVPVRVADGTRGLLGGCGPIEQGLFAEGNQPDINNRVCKNGLLTVPPEQANTGGLDASGRVCDLVTPTPDARTGRSLSVAPNCVTVAGTGSSATSTPSASPDSAGRQLVPPVQQPPAPISPRSGATPRASTETVPAAAPEPESPAGTPIEQFPVAPSAPPVAPQFVPFQPNVPVTPPQQPAPAVVPRNVPPQPPNAPVAPQRRP